MEIIAPTGLALFFTKLLLVFMIILIIVCVVGVIWLFLDYLIYDSYLMMDISDWWERRNKKTERR